MGRRVFLSYKYSDSELVNHKYRDKLIELFKGDGNIYNGEDGFSDDLSNRKSETIKKYLADMLFNTTVTVILITPNVSKSNWIDWEISYSLQVIDRSSGKSRTNGLIGIIVPDINGNYDYVKEMQSCKAHYYKKEILPRMMLKNRYNVDNSSEHTWVNDCSSKVWSEDYGNYCSIYTYGNFVQNIEKHIELSFEKSKELRELYDIKPQLNQ